MENQSTTLKNTGSHHAVIDTIRTKPFRIGLLGPLEKCTSALPSKAFLVA